MTCDYYWQLHLVYKRVHNYDNALLFIKLMHSNAHYIISVTNFKVDNVADEELFHYVPPVVACFVNSSAFERERAARYSIEGIPCQMCTHIVYSYFSANPNTGELISNISIYIDANGDLKELYCLKKKDSKLKLLLSFDNGNAAADVPTTFLSDRTKRKAFVDSVESKLLKFGFDGLNIHWGARKECDLLKKLLKELKKSFDKYDFLLTITLPACSLDCDLYKKKIAKLVDYVFLSTFHYKPGHVGKVDVPSPPFTRHFEKPGGENSEDCLGKWVTQSLPTHKLVFGLSLLGASYTLADPNKHELLSDASSANPLGKPGEFTKTPGKLGYFEISFVKGNRLGGVFLWSLDLDDYRGDCGPKYPMLTAIDTLLGDYDVSTFVFKENCYNFDINLLTPEKCTVGSAFPKENPKDCGA
ncbi:endochitinase-like [Ixodes scapularis]|uniref:endochitinase-like n=1 Tax=Ixodes scapularis TaxID=6945 RepID=UPI001C391023|nr:endochitinase-like [Ixodes scapularis]